MQGGKAETVPVKKNRDSNIELLRIIAIGMIVGLHYFHSDMGGLFKSVERGSLNYYISHIFESIFIIGPNLFVAISSYFMAETNKIKIRKITDLYILMVFWAVVFYIIGLLLGSSFNAVEFVQLFVPFLFGRRWFVETYLLFLLFVPFINLMLNHINQNSFRVLLLFQVLIYSVWPSFLTSSPTTDQGYGLLNFITIYLIIGYIKRFISIKALKNNKGKLIILYSGSMIAVVVLSILPGLLNNDVIKSVSARAWNYDFLCNLTAAVSLFLLFRIMVLKPSKIINIVASTTFGIFLIHSDFTLSKFFYQTLLRAPDYYDSEIMFLHMAATVVILFVGSALLELARKAIWKRTIDRAMNKIGFLNAVIKLF